MGHGSGPYPGNATGNVGSAGVANQTNVEVLPNVLANILTDITTCNGVFATA